MAHNAAHEARPARVPAYKHNVVRQKKRTRRAQDFFRCAKFAGVYRQPVQDGKTSGKR